LAALTGRCPDGVTEIFDPGTGIVTDDQSNFKVS